MRISNNTYFTKSGAFYTFMVCSSVGLCDALIEVLKHVRSNVAFFLHYMKKSCRVRAARRSKVYRISGISDSTITF